MTQQYLLSVHSTLDAAALSEAEIAKMYADVEAFNQGLRDAGAWVFAGGLEPADTAVVISHSGDEVVTTDGPFSAAEAQVGGFWVIEVADRDAALTWAADAGRACQATIEVRPFQQEPEA